MDVELRTYMTVWFGIRAPDWDEYDDDEEWEDRIFTEKIQKKRAITIRKSAFRHDI